MTTTRVVLIALTVFLFFDLFRFALEIIHPRERIIRGPTTFSIDTPNTGKEVTTHTK